AGAAAARAPATASRGRTDRRKPVANLPGLFSPVMRAAPLVGVLLAAAVLAGASPAGRPPSDRALAARGLQRAVDAGALTADEAAGYDAILRRVPGLLRTLPPLRARELRGVVHDVAAQRGAYNRPRALTLFSMLALNEDWLSSHRLPESGTDV